MNAGGLLGDRYELGDVLGFGGMAEVRDGWDHRLNRAVAIKVLHPGLGSQAETCGRFKVEACAAAALSHPNIVRVFDFGEHDGIPFIVMERLSGETLGDQIVLGPLPQARVYALLTDVLRALAVAHGAGMLHRDIKPGNILLSDDGVKVADFGIVKTPGSAHTTTGQLVGTLAYLSSDRIAGVPASVADDLYAVGVVGYETLTARKPFMQEDIAPLARAITEEQPPSLAELRPDVDLQLVDVIERAMSRDPSRRFGTADEMCRALSAEGGRGRSAVPVPHSTRPFVRPTAGPSSAHHSVRPEPVAVMSAPALRRSNRVRGMAGAAAVLGALAVLTVVLAPERASTTVPSVPQPVGIGTSSRPPAPTVATAIQATEVQSLAPAPPSPAASTVEPAATVRETPVAGNGNRGGGHGNGHGNGHGGKKAK